MTKKICILLPWSINRDSRAQRTAITLAKKFIVEIFCISADDTEINPGLLRSYKIKRIKSKERTVWDRFYLPFHSSSMLLFNELKQVIHEYDIIYCHDLPSLMAICKLKQRNDFKIVYDIHDIYLETINQGINKELMSTISWVKSNITSYIFKFFINRIEGNCITNANLVFTVNESITTYIKEKYRIDCKTIQNFPINLDVPEIKKLRKKLDLSLSDKIVIYHGNLGGGRYLNEIVESSKYYDEHIYLVIMGNGQLQGVLETKAGKNAFFLNSVPYESLFEYTSDANLGLVLLEHINYSKKHASANKLFEYMACGIATLASDSPELIKVIEAEKNGIITKNFKPKDIALRINEFFRNEKEAILMGNQGRKAFENKYNWGLEEKKMLKLFEFNDKNNDCNS